MKTKKRKYCFLTGMALLICLAMGLPTRLMGEETQVVEAPAVVETVAEVAVEAPAVAEAEVVAEVVAEEAVEAEATEAEETVNPFVGTAWALVPPLLAIILALIMKEVFLSLFIGVLLGGCLVANFAPLQIMDVVINDGFIEAVKGTAGVFIFLVMLGVVVALINKTGATAAFGRWAQSHVKTRIGAILSTFLLGVLIFIDDYFNCLTVGSVMQPVTDAKRVSRAKLAYIIDATAAPICMIAPISSWAAAVSQYADGTNFTGLEMFVRAIPYNLYSLLTFIFIVALTLFKVDYGPMAMYEKNAIENGDLFSGKEAEQGIKAEVKDNGCKVIDMILPIILLIVICVFALVYVGGILDGKSFIDAFGDTDATVALPWGAMLVLMIVMPYLILRGVITRKDAIECIPKGFIAMVPAILILTFATALKNMTGLLEGKEFIAQLMSGSAEELYQFLPAVIFLVATFLAFSTGTSWGTFGILIPIVVGIFPPESSLLFIGMSACLAGAVCGDHCSPISDTTIMSSAGAGCDHITHTSTQLPYVLTVAAVSFIGFILAGIIQNWFIVFPISVVILIGLLLFAKKFVESKAAK